MLSNNPVWTYIQLIGAREQLLPGKIDKIRSRPAELQARLLTLIPSF